MGGAHGGVHNLHGIGRHLLFLGLLLTVLLADLGVVANLAALQACGVVRFSGRFTTVTWTLTALT